MRKILLLISLCAANSAFAEPAIWTGNKEKVETSTGQVKWKCEYRIANTTQIILVWKVFPDACPAEIDTETE